MQQVSGCSHFNFGISHWVRIGVHKVQTSKLTMNVSLEQNQKYDQCQNQDFRSCIGVYLDFVDY